MRARMDVLLKVEDHWHFAGESEKRTGNQIAGVIHLKGQAVAQTYERIGERGAFYALIADERAAEDSG